MMHWTCGFPKCLVCQRSNIFLFPIFFFFIIPPRVNITCFFRKNLVLSESPHQWGSAQIPLYCSLCSLSIGGVAPYSLPTLTRLPSQGVDFTPIISITNRIFRKIPLGGSHNSSSPPKRTFWVPGFIESCVLLCIEQ